MNNTVTVPPTFLYGLDSYLSCRRLCHIIITNNLPADKSISENEADEDPFTLKATNVLSLCFN